MRPPDAPDWQRTAVSWLLDLCPPEYRDHPVLARHPLALAHVAGHHVDAALVGSRRALASARSSLSAHLAPPVMAEVIEAIEAEEVRLDAARRAVGLVADALAGQRRRPRL